MASKENFLNALVYGDQVFINAYMIGTTTFAGKKNRNATLARMTAEFMGTEAVHRALARQSLGLLGNDRAFMKYSQIEEAAETPLGTIPGFTTPLGAVHRLEQAGFGFGKAGSKPGKMYSFDEVSQLTPDPPAVNTRTPK